MITIDTPPIARIVISCQAIPLRSTPSYYFTMDTIYFTMDTNGTVCMSVFIDDTRRQLYKKEVNKRELRKGLKE